VHGRWNYIRQSRVFLYSLHKNMVLTLTLYWFSYFTAGSGTSPYETWIYSGFNLILGLPIIFYGILDRDLTDDFVTKYPQVYVTGKQNRYLRNSAIGMWILNAIAFATVLCLSFYYCVRPTFKEYSLYSMGTVCYTGLCNALQFKVAFMSHQWALPQVVSMVISVGGMLAAYVVFSNASGDYYGVSTYLFNTPMFWFFGFFSVPLFAGLIDVVEHNLNFFFRPSEEMLFREVDLQRYVLLLSHETLACPPKHSRAQFPSLTNPESIPHPLPLFPFSLNPSKPLSNPSKSNLNNRRAYTNDPLASAKSVGLSNADADDGIEMGGLSRRRF
jgi:magnesium-transporting ATPase (P-type)